MFRGTGLIDVLATAEPAPAGDQWNYVVYAGLAVAIALLGLGLFIRSAGAARGESAANERRARSLLAEMAAARNLRTVTHWRSRSDGIMSWEVEAIDDRSGRRWVTTHRKLLEATHKLAGQLDYKIK